MKFDKSKILTVVTADQAKVGQKGWFASNVETLSRLVLEEQPKELLGFDSNNAVHAFKTYFQSHSLFYPASEPTYAERQAEWIKKHNLKVGDKVVVLRTAECREDGWCNDWVGSMNDMVGSSYTYNGAYDTGICLSCGFVWPYFVLEVVKEPTYRPYNNDELNDLVGKVLLQKNTGNAMMAIKAVDGEVGKLISLGGSQKRNAQQLLDGWTHKNGEPCGVKEEI